jgi:hypothetical protein
MGFFHNLMNKLGRYRLIPDRQTGEDYMHRYYLFLKDRTWFPFNVTLHKIVRSDDPIMHDHPWSYMTIVLKGGYWEHTPVCNKDGKMFAEFQTWRGPGSIIKRGPGEYHWLELDENVGPATTLFFMGRQQRDWGFLVQTKKGLHRWIKWTDYLSDWKPYHQKYVAKAASKKKD